MERKDLNYYMKLPYTIEVVPIPESQGGGFTARLPQVGRLAITGDGETPEEAIAALETAKRERFIDYLKRDIKIPEPEEEKEEYSGRFIVRLPKILHRQLVIAAKQNQASLNQYVTYLLASNFHLERQDRQFEIIMNELDNMREAIWGISYSYLLDIKMEEYETMEQQIEEDSTSFAKLKAA